MNTCPKCGCQLEVKLTFASGPKSNLKENVSSGVGDVGSLLDEAEGRGLNQWEEDFIGKLRQRYEQYGERIMLSDKQRGILEKIANGDNERG